MQVVGLTTPQEIFMASKERKFRINELLVIEDTSLGDLIGEVVESNSYNRFIPLALQNSMIDTGVLESLKHLGYSVSDDEINLAKVKLLSEASYAVTTGSLGRLPAFDEVRDFLLKGNREEGLILGEIKNTEATAKTMEEGLGGLFPVFTRGQIKPTENVPFILDLRSFQQYPHIGIFGGSGSGKSYGLRVILEEIMKHRFPALILDPHYEMDFYESQEGTAQIGFRDDFNKFQIGEDIGVEFLHLSKRDVMSLLSAVSPLTEAMSGAVDLMHRRGDSYLSFSSRFEDLAQAMEIGKPKLDQMLRQQDLEQVDRERYHRFRQLLEDYPNIPLASVQGISWRLRRLYSSGLFSNDIKPVKQAMMRGKLAVIQGPIWLLQVFSTYLLSNVYRQRRDYKDGEFKGEAQGDYFPPFIIATDEAHNFAPKGRDAAPKGTITEIAQEGRKYGVFLVLATQRPTLLDETVTAQLNTKVIFRTVRASDIGTIAEETDIKAEEAKRLPYLPSGDAFVSSPVFGRTVAIRVRFPYTRSPHTQNPLDEIRLHRKDDEDELLKVIKPHLPIYAANFARAAGDIQKASGKVYEVNELKSALEDLVRRGQLKVQKSPLGDIYMEK